MGVFYKTIPICRDTKKVEKPRDFDPFGHAGLSPLVTI